MCQCTGRSRAKSSPGGNGGGNASVRAFGSLSVVVGSYGCWRGAGRVGWSSGCGGSGSGGVVVVGGGGHWSLVGVGGLGIGAVADGAGGAEGGGDDVGGWNR